MSHSKGLIRASGFCRSARFQFTFPVFSDFIKGVSEFCCEKQKRFFLTKKVIHSIKKGKPTMVEILGDSRRPLLLTFTQRVLIAAYGVLCFFVQNILETYYAPIIYRACLKTKGWNYWPAFPEYPFGYGVLSITVLIAVLLFFSNRILKILFATPSAIHYSLFSFSGMFGAFLLTIPNYGLQHANLLFGLGHSAVVGFVSGILTIRLDLDFSTDESIAKEARLAKLVAKRDTYFRGLSMFFGLCAALIVSGGLQFFLRDNHAVNYEALNLMHGIVIANIIVICIGLALGIFYPLFQIIFKIEEQFCAIKKAP